jgi:hypothetical protein
LINAPIAQKHISDAPGVRGLIQTQFQSMTDLAVKCWNPDLKCRPRTAGFMSFGVHAPLHYADQQTCLFQAGKELMDFDGYGSFLVGSTSQEPG